MAKNVEIDQAIKGKRLYFVGEKLPSDWYEAFRIWLPLAQSGDSKAQFNVGRCYSLGDGIDKDVEESIKWLLKSAEQGDPRSHFNLYLHYLEVENIPLAKDWLAQATNLCEPRAMMIKAKELLSSGHKSDAKQIFKQALDGGYEKAKLGLIACDIEISNQYYSNSVSYDNGVHNGTTVRGSYRRPACKSTLRNSSPHTAHFSAWIASEDRQEVGNDFKKNRIDFWSVSSGKVKSISQNLTDFYPKSRLYFTGYTLWAGSINSEEWEYFELSEKVLIGAFSDGCFVLTACYGQYDEPTVVKYRQFRDSYLSKSHLGNSFINFYYSHGPKWAASIEKKPKAKAILRQIFKIASHLLPQ